MEKSTTGTITIKNSIFESETADILNPKFTVDNTATLNVVNMYVKDAVNLFTNNHFPANTTFEGLYFDVTKISRNNYAQTYASGASTITFKDSYIYGTATGTLRLIASHANQKNLTAGTRVATYHNNTLKFKQAYGMLYTESHDTSSMVVTNNYMDKTVDGGAELIYSPVRIGSRLTGDQETSLVFENNKVVGYGKTFYSAITTEFTPRNNFVTSATAANAASATGVAITSPSGKTGAYWVDYAMTKSSAALTLDSELALGGATTVTVDGTKVAIEGETGTITANDVKTNAFADAPEGSVEPTVTIKDATTGVAGDISLSKSGLYIVTVEFEGYDAVEYIFNVNDFDAPLFTQRPDENEKIKSTAVLVNTSLKATADPVFEIWGGNVYKFVYGTNAFNSMADALASEATQIIVTGWNGSELSINKAVEIFTPNWNTEPFVRPESGFVGGKWSATASNGEAWTENTDTFDDSFKANGAVIDSSVSGTVGLYGFYYTTRIDIDGATNGRGGSADKLTVNIVNSKYYSTTNTPFNAQYKNVTSSDETNITNFYIIKSAARLFHEEYPAPYTTFDGLYYNFDDLTINAYHKTSTANSKFEIKNSYLFGTSSKNFKVSVKDIAYAEGDTRKVVFDNNVMKYSASGGMVALEPHDTTTLTVTNNYMDKSVDKSALLIYTNGVEVGKEVAEDVEKTITFTGNKIVGFERAANDVFDSKFNDAKGAKVEIADNYVTSQTSDFSTVIGSKLADDAGNTGAYYLDYNMTVKNTDVVVSGFKVGNESIGTINGTYAVVNGYKDGADGLYGVTVQLGNGAEGLEGAYYADAACTTPLSVDDLKASNLAKQGKVATVYYKVKFVNNSQARSTNEFVSDDVYTVVVLLGEATDYTGSMPGIEGETVVYAPTNVAMLPDNSYYAVFAGKVYKFTIDGATVFANSGATLPAAFEGKNVILPAGKFGNLDVTFGAKFYGSNYGINPNNTATATAANNFDWEFNTAWDKVNSTKVTYMYFKGDHQDDKVLKVDGIELSTYLDNSRTMAAANLDATLENIVVSTPGDVTHVFIEFKSTSNFRHWAGWNAAGTNKPAGVGEADLIAFGERYDDSLTLKNIRVDSVGKNFHFIDEVVPEKTVIDGLYYDADAVSSTAYGDIGIIKQSAYATELEFEVNNSNIRNDGSFANRWFVRFSGNYTQLPDGHTSNVVFDNNILYNTAQPNYAIIDLNGTSGSLLATKLEFTNNTVIETTEAEAHKVISHSGASGKPAVTEAEFSGNKFVGFAKANVIPTANFAGNQATLVHENSFATEANDAHTRADEVLGYEINEGTDYYLNYAGTMTTAAITLQNVEGEFDYADGVISADVGSGITKQDIIANALLDTKEGTIPPTVTIKDYRGNSHDEISTTESTLYLITVEYKGYVAKRYELNVGEFEASYFTTHYNNATIASTAVLVDITIGDHAAGDYIVKEWDGEEYVFVAGVNAFASYDEAKGNLNAQKPQIIVTAWDGTALTIDRAVEVFSPNWNTVPMLEMADGFDALASNGADWTPNTENWVDGFKLASLAITTADVDVSVYGFEYNGTIALYNGNTAVTGNDGEIVIKNSVFDAEATVLKMNDNVHNTGSFDLVNMYVKASKDLLTNKQTYTAANLTFDGLYFDFGNNTTVDYNYILTSSKKSTVTIKDSYLFGTTAKAFAISHTGQANTKAGTTSEDTRTVTFKNNTLKYSASGKMIVFEPHDTTKVDIQDNFMDFAAATSDFIFSSTQEGNGYYVGSRLVTNGHNDRFAAVEVVVEGNKIVNFTAGTTHFGSQTAANNKFTPKNNFLTSASAVDAVSATGVAVVGPKGATGAYWLDYAMTKSSAALTIDTDTIGEVNGSVISVDGAATITKDQIIAAANHENYATAADKVVIKDISGKEVNEISFIAENKTIFNVEISFDGYTEVQKYLVDVNGFIASVKAFDSKDDANDKIKNTAVLVDVEITEATGETVYREWDGVWYSFVVGTNAFTTYAAAQTKALAGGRQVILYSHSGDLEVTVNGEGNAPFQIFGKNWNVTPYTKDAQEGDWSALKSSSADWAYNEAYNANEIVVNSLKINGATMDNVEIYGITIDGQYNDSQRNKANARSGHITLENVKFNGNVSRLFHMHNGYNNTAASATNSTDTLIIKNSYIKLNTGSMQLFGDGSVAANIEFNGVFMDGTGITLGSSYLKYREVKNASFTIRNSCFKNVKGSAHALNFGAYYADRTGTGTGSAASYPEDATNVVTYDNNVFDGFAGHSNTSLINWYAAGYTAVTVTNNNITSASTSSHLFYTLQTDSYPAFDQPATVTVTGNILDGYGDMALGIDGRAPGANWTGNFTGNFLSPVTAGTAGTVYGIDNGMNFGTSAYAYLDRAMTMKSTALTLESGAMGGINVTVDGSTVTVSGTEGKITEADIIANAMRDTEGSAEPTVTIKEISGQTADGVDLTKQCLYFVTVDFEGYGLHKYTFLVNGYDLKVFSQRLDEGETIKSTAVLVDTTITEEDGETVYGEWDGEWYSFVVGENAFATFAAAEANVNEENPQIIITGWNGEKLSVTKSVSVYTPNWNTAPMLEMADANWKATESNGADWTVNTAWKSGFVANGFETTVTNIDVAVYGFEYTGTLVPKHNGTSGSTIIKNSIFNNKDADLINVSVANANAYSLDIVNMRADNVKNLMSQNAMPAFLTIDGLYLNIENFNRNNYLQANGAVAESSITLKNSYIYGTTKSGFAFSHAGSATANSGYRDNIITNNVLMYNAAGTMVTVEPHDTTKFELSDNFMDFAAATTDYLVYANPNNSLYYFGSRVTSNNSLKANIDSNIVVSGNKIVNYKTDANAPATNFAAQIHNNNTIIPVNNYTYGAAIEGVYGQGYALAGTNGTTAGDYYLDYAMTIKNSDLVISGYEVNGQNAGTINNTIAIVNGYMQDADGLYNVTVKLANGNEDTTGKYYYDDLCTEEVTAENRKAAELAKLGKVVTLYYKVTKGDYTRVYTVVVLLGEPTDYTSDVAFDGIEGDKLVFTPKNVTMLPGNSYYAVFAGEVYKFTIDGSTVYANSGANLPNAAKDKNVILPAGDFGGININWSTKLYGSNYGINPSDVANPTAELDWSFNSAWDRVNASVFTLLYVNTNANEVSTREFSIDGVVFGQYRDNSRDMTAQNLHTAIKNSVADGAAGNYAVIFELYSKANYRHWMGWNAAATNKPTGKTEEEMVAFGATYDDSLTIENVRVVGAANNFHLFNEAVAKTTIIDGLYMDLENLKNAAGENVTGYGDLGVIKQNAYASDLEFSIKNSNIRGKGTVAGRPFVYITGNHTPLGDRTNTVEMSGNILYNTASDNTAIINFSCAGTGAVVTDFAFNNNTVIETENAKTHALITHSGKADAPVVTEAEFSGNKFVGFSKGNINPAANFAANQATLVHENSFATEATNAHTTPNAVVGYEINEGTDYYVNFGAPTQVYNGELTISEVTSNSALVMEPSVTGNQISFVLDQGGDPETALSFTYAKTVGGVTGAWGKDGEGNYTSYTVTSKSVPSISKTYTVSAMTEIAEVFTETEDDLGEISKSDAVIFDAGLAGKTKDDIVVSEWKGTKYKFVYGTNAFSTYTEAETKAATTASKQLLIAGWNASDALSVTKAVNIYTSNWDVEPFVRDANGYEDGKWYATKSNGGEWTENTTTFDDSIKANGLVISNTINDTVTVKGFVFTNSIKQSAKRTAGEGVAIYNIVNCKFDGAARVVDMSYQNIYEKQDELNITNMYVKSAKNGLFNASYVVPNITLDGLCVDFANMTAKANQWFDAMSKESTFTIKNSYIVGEYKNDAGTLQNFKPSIYRNAQEADGVAQNPATSRVVTYDNNTFAFNSSGGMIVLEQHDTTEVVITNNFMDKTVDGGDYVIDASAGYSLGQRVPNTEKSIVFEGNKIVGFGNGFAQQLAVTFTPKDNFVYGTLESEDDIYENKRGYALAGIGGSSGRYWVDYDMTRSSAALTMQTADVFTVDGDVVHVGLNATVTAQSIIDNAMLDAPENSVRPTVEVDGQTVASVNTATAKEYTITIIFEDYTLAEYTLNVGNYQAPIGFEFEPFVLISGDNEYNIVWGNNVNSVGYVKIGSATYYDEEDGIVRTDDSIHSVRVPQSVLDNAGSYSVYSNAVVSRNGNDIVINEEELAKKENITFQGYNGDGTVEFAAFSDTHYDPADTSEARSTLSTVYRRVNTGVHKNADVIILDGDIVEQLNTKAEYYALFDYMYYASSYGKKPVIYTIGNHEKRGSYTKELEKYLTFDTGEMYGRVSFGPASILVLDGGEDKTDTATEYGYNDGASFVDMEHYHAEQLNWLQSTGGFDESKKFTFTISHTPGLICYNYGTQKTDFINAINAYGSDLLIGGHVHTNLGFNAQGSVDGYKAINSPVVIAGYQGTGTTLGFLSNSYKASSSKIVCSGEQYAVTYYNQDSSQVNSGTAGLISPAAQALSLRQNAASQPETFETTEQVDNTVALPTRAGISTMSLKAAATKATGIVAGPVVFDGGDYYSVVWQTDSSTKYAGYVQVAGVSKYYNASTGGKLRYGTTHSARIPKNVLDGKKYTVKNRTISNYNAYGYHNGAEVGYGPWINGAQIQFNAQPTGDSGQLTVLAVANKQRGAEDAQALLNEYTDTPDVLVMLGNMAPALNTEQDFGDYILGYAAKVTGGKYPVVFTRGDGEAKGAFAANVSRYINVFSPSTGAMNTLYTGTNYGDTYSFVALDTPTNEGTYANFSTIRAKQSTWLANQNAQTEYKLAFANSATSYATTLNGNGTHLTVSAGSESGNAALNKVAVGSGSSTATVGDSLGIVITCGNEKIKVETTSNTYLGSIVLGSAPAFSEKVDTEDTVIKNTAVLVDTNIVATENETVFATWDNVKYSFTYGVNAFNSLEAALTNVNPTNPQIIMTGWNGGDLVINKAVSIYSPAWNTVPMTEMEGSYDPIATKGADWNENSDFNEQAIAVANVVFGKDITADVGMYGFIIKNQIFPAGGVAYNNLRTTAPASPITYTIKNSRIDQTTAARTFAGHYLSKVDNNDTLNFTNVQYKNVSAIIGDIELHANVNFTKVYIDLSDIKIASPATQSNSYFKTGAVNSTLTFDSCNIQGTTTSNFTFAFSTLRETEGSTRQINLINNALCYTEGAGKSTIHVDDYKITGLNIVGNYVDMSNSADTTAFVTTNAAAAATSTYQNGFVVTDNKIVGFKRLENKYAFSTDSTKDITDESLITIENNYATHVAPVVEGVATDFTNIKGGKLANVNGVGGDYYLNYAMDDDMKAYDHITVNVSWGAMEFNFTETTWDTEACKWNCDWTAKEYDGKASNFVTVDSVGYTDINVKVEFAANDQDSRFDNITGSFVYALEGEQTPVAKAAFAVAGKSLTGVASEAKSTYLTLAGGIKSRDGWDENGVTVGRLTVTIDA